MNQLFASGGQSIGASAAASVLAVNIQGSFPFRIDWFDLLAVQGTLKSLLQHHNLKASILWLRVRSSVDGGQCQAEKDAMWYVSPTPSPWGP